QIDLRDVGRARAQHLFGHGGEALRQIGDEQLELAAGPRLGGGGGDLFVVDPRLHGGGGGFRAVDDGDDSPGHFGGHLADRLLEQRVVRASQHDDADVGG